ncbi:MAG: CBS domain-containing protein [Nitrospirae bacterium]|nr:CBS domain-containing protein [Nitrospirota bacterium]
MDVITTHLNADFDALASMVAAKKYYPEAVLAFPGSQEKNVRDFLASSHLPLEFKRLKDIDLQKVTRLILVDVKSFDRIGRFTEILCNEGLTIHIYDHHPFTDTDTKGHKEVIDNVGATTTIFAEMLQKDKILLSPAEATLMMLGIYEETGSLLFPSTTVRDLSAAAYLLKKGANLKIVSSFFKREPGPEEIDLLNELIHNARDYVVHDIRIKIAKASRETYMGDIAFLAHKIREMEDVDAIFLLVMMENRVQVIARSHTPEVDAAEVLHELGGGGHPQAASAVVRDMSLEETGEKLLDILGKKIHPTKTAKDIMTSPVKSIPWNKTLKTAEKIMTQYEVNVLPVLKNNTFYGLLSREVVEKALFHGFGQSRLDEFCTTGAPSVSPLTPISIVESMMIEQNQRFMPVVENSHIVGAITRTDLLRSLYESLLRKNMISGFEKLTEKPSIGKNLSSLLKSKFPSEIYNLLRLSGEVARDLGFTAYLVGGSVRDLLRGESNLDIDIVIEGDGIAFAQVLGNKLKVKVKTHKRFGTAVIVTDFLKFDVATSRTEYYESPAALPRVETSSIKKDLYRRDFTINTMAVMLNPEQFGKLLDFFGGQRDIKEKTLRILHNLSFIEDPTRAFRAIRFSERFGFTISKHTMNLIKTAVRMDLFNKLSGARMYDELNLLFTETEPLSAINRLHKFDLLKFIHKSLTITPTLKETFTAIQETFAWFKLLFFEEELSKSHLFLMALLNELTPVERNEALKRLYVPLAARKEILGGIEQAEKVLTVLTGASEKEIYKTLMSLDIPTVLFTMARARDRRQKKAISLYLTTLRKIKPELTGEDLKRMGYAPGPLFRKILTSLLEARLERRIKSRQEEVEFLKENFPVKSNRL